MTFSIMELSRLLLLLLCFGSTVRRSNSSPVSIQKDKDLFNCNLSSIPENLHPNTTHLILDQNNITNLTNLDRYPKLEYLTLSMNQLIIDWDLRGISQATNLIFLDLSSNNLQTLNMGTFRLNRELKYLYLDNNTNIIIDGVISNMLSLEEVSLENCNLSALPWTDFRGAPNLKRLNLLRNPIQDIPKEVIYSMPISVEMLVDRHLYMMLSKRSDVKDKMINLKCSKETAACTDFRGNVADELDIKNQTAISNKSDVNPEGSTKHGVATVVCIIIAFVVTFMVIICGIAIYRRKLTGKLKIDFLAGAIYTKSENNSEVNNTAHSETSPLNEDVPEICVDENNHTVETVQSSERETTV